MTKKKRPEDKKKTGAKTKYSESLRELAERVCTETGATDKQLAKILKVSEASINNWKKEHPEFLESLKKGKDVFDRTNVEASLLKRCLGYEYIETMEEVSRQATSDQKDESSTESSSPKKAIKRKTTKQMAPDVVACMYWLQNRHKDRWKNVKYMGHADFGQDIDWEKVMNNFGNAIEGKFIEKPE